MAGTKAFDSDRVRDLLRAGLLELNMPLNPKAVEKLVDYVGLLNKWNRAYNLTAVRDPLDMVSRHLLDSIVVSPHLGGGSLIDVGSGAGLPGIPLAILDPGRPVTLLDSNGKKTRFLVQVTGALGLANVAVVNSRAEAYHPDKPFSMVITRAFSSLAGMLETSRHLIAPDGCFLAMKGAYPEEELGAVPPDFTVLDTQRLVVPGLNADRHLLTIGWAQRDGCAT